MKNRKNHVEKSEKEKEKSEGNHTLTFFISQLIV
jgi:hypothetical protein